MTTCCYGWAWNDAVRCWEYVSKRANVILRVSGKTGEWRYDVYRAGVAIHSCENVAEFLKDAKVAASHWLAGYTVGVHKRAEIT